jgi:smad nuclear-interacting protein 1
LYVFKGQETLETVQLGERTCWLFGRERAVADFPVEHPSCSKQHAVLQFRHVEKKNEFGDRKAEVRPYIIDLESANGTKVNGERVPERRFWEVVSGDVLAFGDSTREYVLMLAPKA